MRNRTLLTPLFLLALHTSAQTPVSLSALHSIAIRLRPTPNHAESSAADPASAIASADPASANASAGFSHFIVLDERADTSRIGIHTCIPDFGHNYDRQLIFHRPAAREIADFLNQGFTRPTAPFTALIILRTLWLSDAHYAHSEYLRHPERRLERTHIRLKAEIYAVRNDRYFPMLRFDTLQTTMRRRILEERSAYHEWGVNLAILLGELADSASVLTPGKAESRRWLDLRDIQQFNASRFNAPIDANLPARGVYANFEEFRNNTPSIQNFEIKLENHQRILYIRESGETFYSHDAWGYSDGKDIFVMRDGILRPAWKEGKAYYLPTGATSGNSLPLSRDRDYRQRSIFFIDMDTGDIY